MQGKNKNVTFFVSVSTLKDETRKLILKTLDRLEYLFGFKFSSTGTVCDE